MHVIAFAFPFICLPLNNYSFKHVLGILFVWFSSWTIIRLFPLRIWLFYGHDAGSWSGVSMFGSLCGFFVVFAWATLSSISDTLILLSFTILDIDLCLTLWVQGHLE